jgi:hypothetical protein
MFIKQPNFKGGVQYEENGMDRSGGVRSDDWNMGL